MRPTTAAAAPAAGVTAYELRLAGHLDDHWSGMLGDLALSHGPDGTTTLTGPVADQAQLHGLLARVRDLGVTLLSLRVITSDASSRTAQMDGALLPALAQPLRTDRLTLRSGTVDDAYATWRYRRLEAVSKWLTEIQTDLEAYRSMLAAPHRLAATVIAGHDGQVIGDFMLRVEGGSAQAEVADQARATEAELGWVLDPVHTGNGYAAEAARALLDHCFATLGLRRVVASCFAANDSSCRLMGRLGMRREGLAIADSLHYSGKWLDTATYAVRATEWRH
jgi:RimJ/RimL family protein N-acetyltransferase